MLQTPLRPVENLPLVLLMALGAIVAMAIVVVVVILIAIKIKQPDSALESRLRAAVAESESAKQTRGSNK